jgi:hypothetical protein
VKSNGTTVFSKNDDLYGGGFIVEQNRMRGNANLHDHSAKGRWRCYEFSCGATDIASRMLNSASRPAKKLNYAFPRPPGSVPYFRCP